jgi:tetratricopeptide (TPR) repeat protein
VTAPGEVAVNEPDSLNELEGLPGDGASLPSSTGWPGGRSAERRMPGTFKDLLLRRLDLLPNETLHVVQAAAVLGENFDHTVLSHVIAGPAVARRLSELVERGWVLPASPDNPLLFRFKHTLTRETIYGTLLMTNLRVLHQRVGEALESLYPEAQAESVELLAHHFGHSSLREKALGYLVRAGQTATARHALSEGLTYYQQARDIVAQYPLLQPRLAAAIALGLADVHLGLGNPQAAVADLLPLLDAPASDVAPEVYAGAWRRLAAARRSLGDFATALDNLQTARQTLASPAVTAPALAVAEIGQPVTTLAPMAEAVEREAWTIELNIAWVLFDMRGTQGARARAQAEQVLRALDRRRFPELAAETLNLLGGMAWAQNEVDTASQLVRESLAIYQAYGNRGRAAAAYANLGVLAALQQNTESAYDHFALSLALREALGDSLGIAISCINLGQTERNRGRFSEAIHQFTRAIAKARHAEAMPLLGQSLSNMGQAQTLAGQHTAAMATFDEAETVGQNAGLKNVLGEVAWKRADCLVEIGDLTQGERNARQALAIANELNDDNMRSDAWRALARVERQQGRPAPALEHMVAAWQVRSNHPSPVIRMRFAAEYGLALAAAGQTAEAAAIFDAHVNPVELPESAFTLHEVAAALAGLGPAAKPKA